MIRRHEPVPAGAAGITLLLLALFTAGGLYFTVKQSAAEPPAAIQATFVAPPPRKPAEPFKLTPLPPPQAPFQLTIEPTQLLETQQLTALEPEPTEDEDSPLPLLIDCEIAAPPIAPPRTAGTTKKVMATSTTPPVLQYGPPPPYPATLRSSHRSGTVRARIHISPAGKPEKVEILTSTHPDFATATREHILAHWRFAPARQGNTAIASSAIQTLHFRI